MLGGPVGVTRDVQLRELLQPRLTNSTTFTSASMWSGEIMRGYLETRTS